MCTFDHEARPFEFEPRGVAINGRRRACEVDPVCRRMHANAFEID